VQPKYQQVFLDEYNPFKNTSNKNKINYGEIITIKKEK
jgi:hypothetical protein